MSDIIRFLLIVLLIYLAARASFFIIKRAAMLVRIYSLKCECDAKITLHKFPFSPFTTRSEKPDISVEIFDTVYEIRLYSGISGNRFVHFVDERFSVVSRRLRAMTRPSRAATANAPRTVGIYYHSGGRVRVMSPIAESAGEGRRTVRVILFSPAPYEVSFVTKDRSRIRLAFTGDELYGHRIFTPSTFVIFADREMRARKGGRY